MGDEVIVVDDASTDETPHIARKYGCKVKVQSENQGSAKARLKGQEAAKNQHLLFIDSDVLLMEDTLDRVRDNFNENPDKAFVGLFSKNHPTKGFYSNYKNLYMNYIFNKCPDEIDFFFGSIFAIKKGELDNPVHNERYGEDSDTGLNISKKGKVILLDKNLEVIHLKEYSLTSLLKNDYCISYYFTRLFLENKGWTNLTKNQRFSHTRLTQLLTILFSWMALLSLPFSLTSSLLFFTVQTIFNLEFLLFAGKHKGSLFMIKSFFFTIIDEWFMGLGIIHSSITHLTNPNKLIE